MSDNNNKLKEAIIEKAQELVKKGNIVRIMVKRGDRLILNVPLNVGLAGSLIGGRWGVIGAAIAALGMDCKVELQKADGQIIELLSRNMGQRAVDMGKTFVEEIKERRKK